MARRLNTEIFIYRSNIVHNFKYDYSRVYYVNNSTYVDIGCSEHGWFKAKPDGHMAGKGCIQCGFQKSRLNVISNTLEFINKAIAKHGMLYNYSKVNYTRNFIKVEIICQTHGSYFQTPSNHLMGKGCAKCQTYGYCKGIPGSFYVLHNENTTKVGITNRGAKKRCNDIIKESGIPFQIICELKFTGGGVPQDIEKRVLDYLRAKYKTVDKVFNGSTECFLNVDLHSLTEFLKPQRLNNQS